MNKYTNKAKEYEDLKLIADHPGERRKYLEGKGDFINKITQEAIDIYTN